jgi:hypothetical protein
MVVSILQKQPLPKKAFPIRARGHLIFHWTCRPAPSCQLRILYDLYFAYHKLTSPWRRLVREVSAMRVDLQL